MSPENAVHEYSQGLVGASGGERNGIAGNVAGRGGNVRFGIEGREGMLGSGGSVGFGKDGWVVGKDGNVGCGIVGRDGKGGTEGFCRVGSDEGKGGNVGITGIVGMEGGVVSRRRRAARLTSMLQHDTKTKRDKMQR